MTDYVNLIERAVRVDEVKDLIVDLARQETPEAELQEADPRIHQFIRGYVAPWLRDRGVERITFDSSGNLLARVGEQAGDRSLLLLSYAMNHAPDAMANPYSGDVLDGARFGIDGECVWGRGLCEQKGPMAAMLASVQAVLEAGDLAGELLFAVVTAGESGRHDSVIRLVEESSIRPDICVLGIGTGNRICLGNKGNVKFTVTVHGESAHVSQRWLGRSAIDGAIALIQRVNSFPPAGEHPNLGPALITVEGIRSEPFGESTVPALCEVAVDRRLLPGEVPQSAFEALRKAIGTRIDGYDLSYRIRTFQYAAEIPRSSLSHRLLAESSRVMLGRQAEDFFSSSALDAGYLVKEEIETVQFGPGDMRFAHTSAEVVGVREVWEAARVLAYATLSYLGSTRLGRADDDYRAEERKDHG